MGSRVLWFVALVFVSAGCTFEATEERRVSASGGESILSATSEVHPPGQEPPIIDIELGESHDDRRDDSGSPATANSGPARK